MRSRCPKEYELHMEVKRTVGMPCSKLLDGVKKAYSARSLEFRDAKVMCVDREQWRYFVNATNDCMRYDRTYFQCETM